MSNSSQSAHFDALAPLDLDTLSLSAIQDLAGALNHTLDCDEDDEAACREALFEHIFGEDSNFPHAIDFRWAEDHAKISRHVERVDTVDDSLSVVGGTADRFFKAILLLRAGIAVELFCCSRHDALGIDVSDMNAYPGDQYEMLARKTRQSQVLEKMHILFGESQNGSVALGFTDLRAVFHEAVSTFPRLASERDAEVMKTACEESKKAPRMNARILRKGA